MINIETFARGQLDNTKLTPAERKAVEGMVLMAEGWNLNHQVVFGQTTSTDTNHTASQLVEREYGALKDFFGIGVPVIIPPTILLETQKIAEAEGFKLEPIYFPAVEFRQKDKYNGWKVKPGQWYWDLIKAGKISRNAAKLGGYWTLFDESVRPNYDGGKQLFEDDGLAPILQTARQEGKIIVPDYLTHIPETSRFGLSPNEHDQAVFPQMAKSLRLIERVREGIVSVRRPTEIEFNFAGNFRYPHLGRANTWEYLQDKFGVVYRLFGGDSCNGGLAGVNFDWSGDHGDCIAFRPLVEFSPKA